MAAHYSRFKGVKISTYLTFYMAISSLLLQAMSGCTTPSTASSANTAGKLEATEVAGHGQWYEGSMEQALAEAKSKNKMLFVYWGAKWCPPCNEMKSTVFNQRAFWELMSAVIPVYLDGDSENAQTWGDKLHASGYPTLMFLGSDGRELSRISTGVSMAEFKEAFQAVALAKQPIDTVLARVKDGKATEADFRLLAYVSWEQMDYLSWTAAQKLETAQLLYDKVPVSLAIEKTIFAGNLLNIAAGQVEASDAKAVQLQAAVKKRTYELLQLVFASPAQEVASRGLIVYGADSLVPWVMETLSAKDQQEDIEKKWLIAAQRLSKDKSVSIDIRLWAVSPQLAIYRWHNPPKVEAVPVAQKGKTANAAKESVASAKDKPKEILFPDVLKQEVLAAVESADKEAKSEYERQAVMSGASHLLDQVGETKLATKLLEKEVKLSPSPYYYQSILARRSKDAGNFADAVKWADAARLSAEGRATKIQWLVSELSLILDFKDVKDAKVRKKYDKKVEELLEQYYNMAFNLPDGFSGRNASSSKRVATKLAPDLKKKASWRKVVGRYQKMCGEVTKKSPDAACAGHFNALTL